MLKQLVKNGFNKIGYELTRSPSQQNKICWPKQTLLSYTSFETDKVFHDLYEHAQSMTQMSETDNALRRQRHYTLNQLLKYAIHQEGDICELGCWRGLSAYQIATHLKQIQQPVNFHIFDSFEGLSEIETVDTPTDRQQDNPVVQKTFACSQETVENNLSEFPFIRYYKGWIPEKLHEVENNSFAFVHVDVDLYQPIRDSFRFFYHRLIKRGIMVFDDYGASQFPGAKQSIDEILEEFNNPFFVALPSGQSFLIKDL